jgi:hypothetical protein
MGVHVLGLPTRHQQQWMQQAGKRRRKVARKRQEGVVLMLISTVRAQRQPLMQGQVLGF